MKKPEPLPARVCCGETMGISPSWTDTGWWRYQCAANPTHFSDGKFGLGWGIVPC